jgi:hypothetical protein
MFLRRVTAGKMSEDFEKKFFDHVDEHTPLYIERLAEAVG